MGHKRAITEKFIPFLLSPLLTETAAKIGGEWDVREALPRTSW
jgi:hypothetical protein